jgi:hypothetical protein
MASASYSQRYLGRVARTRQLHGAAAIGILSAIAALLGVVAWLATPANLLAAYDQFYALAWGRDLARGVLPDFASIGASTPHPLTVLAGALVSVFGSSAPDALELTNYLAWGVVVVACGSIGWNLLTPAAGIAGAVVLAANPYIFDQLTAASADAYYIALASTALAVEVRRPRAGAPVLVLLAAAGLCRPEAWLLSLAYWTYLTRGRLRSETLLLGGLAVSAPFLWITIDTLVTGEPFFSLTKTQTGARRAGRQTGIAEVVPQLRAAFGSLTDAAQVIGGLLGVAIALQWRRTRALLPVAVLPASVAGFAVLGVARLPMQPRYLLLCAVLLSVAAGWALAARLVWRPSSKNLRDGLFFAAVVTAVLFAVSLPDQWTAAKALRHAQQPRARVYGDLQGVARFVLDADPGRRCSVSSSTFKITSILAYDLHRRPAEISQLRAPTVPHGFIVLPSDATVAARFRIPPRRLAAVEHLSSKTRIGSWVVANAC